MRILNICFKNINSLEGEGRIHFDQGPIADSGVFAITGPNGSGKTSILDVITLGLYGETFRFDKPAAHVMTKQTDDCFAQVEFALGEEKFRSTWNAARSEGEVQIPRMTLQRIDGQEEVLAETPAQVRNRIAELTGMDFHKFSKSMVLPQGDFAAFLHALDSERLDILEKISGSDLYADYRRQAEEQFSQAKTGLDRLQQDIASIPLLNQEAIDIAELDLHDFQDQAVELKQQQQAVLDLLAGLQNVAKLGQQRQQLERQRSELQSQAQHYDQDLRRIEAGRSVLQYRNDLTLVDDKQLQLERHRSTLETYRRESAMLQQQLSAGGASEQPAPNVSLEEQKQAIDSLKLTISEIKLELPRQNELAQAIQQQVADNQSALGEVENWLRDHASDAVLLTDFPDLVRLRNLRGELAELSSKQKAQANWSKNTTSALKKNKSALDTTRADLADLQEKIEADQQALDSIAQGRSFDELKETLQEQQIRVSEFQELNALAEVTARLSKKGWFSWLGGNKQDDLPDEAEIQTKLDALLDEMQREENIIKVLEQAIRNEAIIKKMSADRAKLVEGQPCYLCGSTYHPYVLKPPVMTGAKKALVDQRGKIQALKSRIDSAMAQLKAAQKANSQMNAKQARLQQIRSQWILLANRLAVMRDGMEIGNLSLQKRLLTEETEELSKLNELVKQHAQLQRDIEKAKNSVVSKQAQLEKFTAAVTELEENWNNRPPEYIQVEQRLQACQAEEKALVEKLEAQLGALGEKLPKKGKENPLFDRFNARRQDYQIYQLRQKGLQDEINALNEKLQACQSTIIAYQERLSSSLEALGAQEKVGLHLALIEKQKLIADEDHQLRVAQIEFDAAQRSLNDKLAAAGSIGTLDELRELLRLIDQEADIQQKLADSTSKLAQLEQQVEQIGATLEAETGLQDASLSESDLHRESRNLGERIDIAEQEIRTLHNKLDKQQQYRERYLALKEQMEEQQRLFAQAESELSLINDEHGGFRRRIQQMMIAKLLSHTNRILEKLSGRYYVRGEANDNGLALEIEDTKQKNLRRLPQTLSGGESFVVSLALALALAEMANNGKAIDSLFLDEGFGNLDAESLYLAMSTLEGLKTQGKTVGVISHVEGVKKRIKTQIELVKKPNGLSELKMVA